MNKTTIISKMGRDGRLSRQTEHGWAEVATPDPLPGHVADNPAYDPDNLPLTPERRARMRRVPRARSLRRALMLTQEEFSARYHIPVGTLRDWEQGRSEPDAPAKAYLKVIAADPEGVAKSLQVNSRAAAV